MNTNNNVLLSSKTTVIHVVDDTFVWAIATRKMNWQVFLAISVVFTWESSSQWRRRWITNWSFLMLLVLKKFDGSLDHSEYHKAIYTDTHIFTGTSVVIQVTNSDAV